MEHNPIVHLPVAILLSVMISSAYSLEFSKESNESNEDFASRIAPGETELVDNVISSSWNGKPAIISFYKEGYKLSSKADPDQQEYFRLLGFAYVKSQGSTYIRYLIDTLDTEGDTPAIESVFVANADKDVAKELILIVSWDQRHAAVSGTCMAHSCMTMLLRFREMENCAL